jgi:hypothetical protein
MRKGIVCSKYRLEENLRSSGAGETGGHGLKEVKFSGIALPTGNKLDRARPLFVLP